MSNQKISRLEDKQFFDTIRLYTERINQEREKSLHYLQKIKSLTELLNRKDAHIAQLQGMITKMNEKLEMYENVLNQSRVSRSLRYSNLFQQAQFAQSIIERVQISPEKQILHEQFKTFQQFFIMRPNDQPNFAQNNSKQNTHNNKLKYLFNYMPQNDTDLLKIQQGIRNYLCQNQTKMWKREQYYQKGKSDPLMEVYFLMNSSHTCQRNYHCTQIATVNPSYYFYCIGILKDQIVLRDSKYYREPTLYAFITYFPYIKYFQQLLRLIIRNIALKTQQAFQHLNSQLMNLQKLSNFGIQPVQFQFYKQNIQWDLPFDLNHVLYGELASCFEDFSQRLVIDVILFLLMQIPVVLLKESETDLMKMMLFFISIIRPFKYPFPVVLNLPASMNIILDSPFPIFVGCNRKTVAQPYINHMAIIDLDEKKARSWPNIDNYDKIQQYLASKLSGSLRKPSEIHKYGQLIKILLNNQNQILKPISEQIRLTQIYNIYQIQQAPTH